ncbi:enoyl-CoA hydratase [Purpureocillium lavendulum]|uniref:Enoyl-CoA hydratase n=1 Tax=Purpureocillium lavendulum TaxID=1247861 RepID=A0AB34FN40_9HYPO|nr:enoyl-CoA hydratase [Purpureocillium lavendulum]
MDANEKSLGPESTATNDGDVFCTLDAAPPGGEGTVATVTLSNPKRLNSLSRELIAKLTATMRSLASQPDDLRCVVVQGAAPAPGKSPSFTTGANIFQMAQLASYDAAKQFITELHRACQAVRDVPVPTMARIDGLCLGGGLELAAACDFRYATRRSTFGMPETKFGIPSVVEARLLANIVGWQRAKEMVYFARTGGGTTAAACETPRDLDDVVTEAVAALTALGPRAVREQKRLVRIWEESDLVAGIEAGVDAYARMFSDGGSEPARYMKPFLERKK